jgi:hypothetical protein
MPGREKQPRRAGWWPARPVLWSRPGSHSRQKPGFCASSHGRHWRDRLRGGAKGIRTAGPPVKKDDVFRDHTDNLRPLLLPENRANPREGDRRFESPLLRQRVGLSGEFAPRSATSIRNHRADRGASCGSHPTVPSRLSANLSACAGLSEERLTVKPALTAAATRRRFLTATGSSPRTGLWVKAIAFMPVLAATSSSRSSPSIAAPYPGRSPAWA